VITMTLANVAHCFCRQACARSTGRVYVQVRQVGERAHRHERPRACVAKVRHQPARPPGNQIMRIALTRKAVLYTCNAAPSPHRPFSRVLLHKQGLSLELADMACVCQSDARSVSSGGFLRRC
jgi:hypothetical protein